MFRLYVFVMPDALLFYLTICLNVNYLYFVNHLVLVIIKIPQFCSTGKEQKYSSEKQSLCGGMDGYKM